MNNYSIEKINRVYLTRSDMIDCYKIYLTINTPKFSIINHKIYYAKTKYNLEKKINVYVGMQNDMKIDKFLHLCTFKTPTF